MTSKLRKLICSIGFSVALGIGCFPESASALDTPNVLMTIDGMTMHGLGLFRNNTPNDGYNTFQFGPVLFAAGQQGRYKSFYFIKNGTGDGGISHNARMHSDTPEVWTGTAYAPIEMTDLDNDYFPFIDRATGGQLFEPTEYQIEVKFKPNIGVAGLPNNAAPFFHVGLDQTDGFVWDAEANRYKRANDAFTYNIGANTPGNTINEWYTAAPKDADGYATWTVPVTSPNFIQRGFYYAFGNNDFRTNNVVTGGGRMFDAGTSAWVDVNDGLDSLSFGGGATDPARPGSQLKAPNGVPLISFGAPAAETGLSIQVKHISLKKITPGSIFARIDANSGITFRYGSALTYGPNLPPITIPDGTASPNATGQISRFDQNGMTNMIINAREPDAGEGPFMGYQYRFNIRGGPSAESFDGSDPNVMMNIRAKLLPSNTATSLTIMAKDLDGNDCTAPNNPPGCNAGNPVGADEYTYNLNLNQFNTSTFTTVSVPLNTFTLSTHVPSANQTVPNHVNSTGPFGFVNKGDELRTDFNLYEFGAGVVAGAGLLRMELEFMELRLAPVVPPGIAGDFNEDDKVDAADYVVWRKNGSGPLPNDNGAATAQARFDLWKANFGEMAMPGGGAGGAVPEPAAWMLMSVAAAPFGLRRRRSTRSYQRSA